MLFRAIAVDIGGDDFRMQAETGAGGAGAGQLFHQNYAVDAVHAAAAVFLGHGGAQQAQFAGLQPGLPADLALFFPFRVIGGDFFIDETAHRVAKDFVIAIKQCSFYSSHAVSPNQTLPPS